jgi:hypothetical protein
LPGSSLPIPGATKLCDQPCLLQLGERASYLAHSDLEWVCCIGEIVARGREHANATVDQKEDAKLLRNQIAGEAARVLNDHRADAVALDPIKERGEARSAFDGIGTADSSIVKLGRQVIPPCTRETLDGVTLAPVAILVTTDVRGRTGAQVSNSLLSRLPAAGSLLRLSRTHGRNLRFLFPFPKNSNAEIGKTTREMSVI